ncbi:MAG TPA: glycoside hydrolase family 130 protein [Ktedonosporobacter sp.]|nr:glycoside hydrolase family 130 protein [Ktedonosporobacter sp.]
MTDVVKRFAQNPILLPHQVEPSMPGLVVECLMNPGAFQFDGKTWLLLRVAERPRQKEGVISTVVIDPSTASGLRILEFKADDPDLDYTDEDPRGFLYQGRSYLTTLSHLRLAWSTDGIHFQVASSPTLLGQGELEDFGIEDCRVTEIAGIFYLTYTAVSAQGFGVGLISTVDWQHFTRHGMILAPNNKDCALFPEKIAGQYVALHRPTMPGSGKNHIWLCKSPDLLHWGEHSCIIETRPGMWDAARVGAGASPIRTQEGWLEIYHGADENHRYCLGAVLFDLDDPGRVIARSQQPLMEPVMEYEVAGFFGSVVFTNGLLVDGDRLIMYYGASDHVVCAATLSIAEVLASLL